jgi:hypothetical protein
MFDEIKKYIGKKWTLIISFIAFGFIVATTYTNFLVTPEVMAQEVKRLELKLDTNIASLKIANGDLEVSLLKKEKNELLDLIDSGKAKQRHRERLEEVKKRIDFLEATKVQLNKILEGSNDKAK